jgi:hypothetical protein
MRNVLPFVPILLAGVVAAAPAAGQNNETIAVGRVGARITHDAVPNAEATLPHPITGVAQALPDIYASLGFPVRSQDAQSISTGLFVGRSRIARRRLSVHLACGTQRGIENADAYEVTLQVQTRLIPVGNTTTTVASTVQASAQPRGTAGSNPVTCSSNGTIEAAILAALNERVAPAP